MKRILFLFFGLLIAFVSGYAYKSFQESVPSAANTNGASGIGGVFFKSKDPAALKIWYQKHLGIQVNAYGAVFEWRQGADSSKKGYTQWSLFKENTTYFAPSQKDFMINYRVKNVSALVKELKGNGVTILDTIATYDYGKFVHILDPEGNKVELWEPNDIAYEQLGLQMGLKTTR